jgi:hypothetical protein
MATINEIQLKIKAWLYEYGIKNTSEELGMSEYMLRKCATNPHAGIRNLERVVKHFEVKEADKLKRLRRLLK